MSRWVSQQCRVGLAARLLLAGLLGSWLSPALAQETLYSLLEKNLQARGGYPAWKALDSLRLLGEMTIDETQTVAVVMEIRRPNLLRFEFALDGQQIVQGFDGENGWLLVSDGISRTLQDMEPEQAREFARTADFEGPLIDWRDKAYSLRYLGLGSESEGGGHVIEVSRPNGERLNLVLGQGDFLTRREDVFAIDQAQIPRVSTQLNDYREVAGIALPFRYQISFPATGSRQQLVLDSIELNVPLSPSRFAKPEE